MPRPMAPASDVDGTGVRGGYGWNGGTGTACRTDAALGLTGILLSQRSFVWPEPPEVVTDFRTGAYAALGG